MTVEFRTTAGGMPTDIVLASASFTPEQVPDVLPNPVGADDLTFADLSTFDIHVSVGDVLAIGVSAGDANWIGQALALHAAGHETPDTPADSWQRCDLVAQSVAPMTTGQDPRSGMRLKLLF